MTRWLALVALAVGAFALVMSWVSWVREAQTNMPHTSYAGSFFSRCLLTVVVLAVGWMVVRRLSR